MENPLRSVSAEFEACAHFVTRTRRARKALVEKKLVRDKPGEPRLTANPFPQRQQPLPLVSALAARECNVRLVGPCFGNKSAWLRRCRHAFLQRNQLRRMPDPGKEDSSAIETAESFKLDWNRRPPHFAKSSDKSLALLPARTAQKLQRNVP